MLKLCCSSVGLSAGSNVAAVECGLRGSFIVFHWSSFGTVVCVVYCQTVPVMCSNVIGFSPFCYLSAWYLFIVFHLLTLIFLYLFIHCFISFQCKHVKIKPVNNPAIRDSNYTYSYYLKACYYTPPLIGGHKAMMLLWRLSVWRLSVCLSAHLSRT